MPCSSNVVRNDSDDVNLWIEVLKSHHHGGGTPCHCPCIDDQHDWCSQDFGNLGSASDVAGTALSVIQPYDPFDHRDISRGSNSTKNVEHATGWHHPGIQVIAGLGGGQGEMGWIDIVQSNFEWLNPDTWMMPPSRMLD